MPGGGRRFTASKAPCARESLRAKWALEDREGVNQYPSHLTSCLGEKYRSSSLTPAEEGGARSWGGAPVDELGLGDREGQAFRGCNAAEGAVVALKELDIPPVRGRSNCDYEMVNVGENQASGYGGMKGGHVNDEQERGDGGSLGCAYCDRGELLRGTVESEPTLPVGEKAAYPGNDVPMYPLCP